MNWPTVTIGDSCNIIAGGTPKRSESSYWDGEIPWVKISDMLQGKITQTDESITQAGLDGSAAKLLPPGTLLVSIFATIGRTAVLDCHASTNQAIVAVIPKQPDQFDTRFLEYSLQEKTTELERKARGAAQVNINGAMLKATQIPLPPLAEQKRIAAILDEADEIRSKRRESIDQLDQLIQSTFLEMFGDPVTNPMGWENRKLGDVLALITYGLTVRPTYQPTGVPLVSASQIKTGHVNLDTAHRISQDDFDGLRAKCKPQYGDILFSKTGAIGHSAILQERGSIALAQNVARLVFQEDDVNNLWGLYYLRTEHIQRMSQQRAKGNAQKDLQLGVMEAFPIYVPPLDLQNRFAEIVTSIEELKTTMQSHQEEAEDLFTSLQHHAFAGTL